MGRLKDLVANCSALVLKHLQKNSQLQEEADAQTQVVKIRANLQVLHRH